MRFVGTSRFSPVALGYDKPDKADMFHIPYDQITKDVLADSVIDELWWEKQYDRCVNGFYVEDCIEKGGDFLRDGRDVIWTGNDCYLPDYDLWIYDRTLHISGRYYFYLNFLPIKGLAIGEKIKSLTSPKFLDIDFLFSRRIEMMLEQMKDSQDSKARQKGFSFKEGGMIAAYNYTFIPSSLTAIVGWHMTDASNTFNIAKLQLDYLANTQFYKDRMKGGDNQELIKSERTLSEIRCVTAKDNPQCLSRYTPYWVIYEEVGKGKKEWSIETQGFVEPSQRSEGIKTGFSTYIGTGGEMEEGVYDLEKRHYNPDNYNLLSFRNKWEKEQGEGRVAHITTDLEYKIIDEEGNSQIEKSIELWEEEYKTKKTQQEKYRFQTQFPKYASDIFLVTGGGYFGESITQSLNERCAHIHIHREANVEKRGWLRWISISEKWRGVKFEADPDGPFYIYEHPKVIDGKVPQNLYVQGTDSYDQDESAYTNSKGASFVRKTFYNAMETSNKYVARVVARPTVAEGGAETFFEYAALLNVYYNCKNLVEHSKIRILDWYKRYNLLGFLKEKPEFAMASMVDHSKTSNRYGIDPNTKPYWLSLTRDRLTDDFIAKMDDVEQMRALARFKYKPGDIKYNCDITIATALCEVAVLDIEEEMVQVKDNKQEYFYYAKDKQGNLNLISR